MKKIVRLTESDLTRIVKRIINENQSQDLAKKAISKSKQSSNRIKSEIVKCIKSGSYTHLMVLTTGVGTTVLGALAVLFAITFTASPALILMAAGAIVITIEDMMTTDDSRGGSVSDELKQLYNCLKRKRVI